MGKAMGGNIEHIFSSTEELFECVKQLKEKLKLEARILQAKADYKAMGGIERAFPSSEELFECVKQLKLEARILQAKTDYKAMGGNTEHTFSSSEELFACVKQLKKEYEEKLFASSTITSSLAQKFQLNELPPDWKIQENNSGKRTYVSPDGFKRFSSLKNVGLYLSDTLNDMQMKQLWTPTKKNPGKRKKKSELQMKKIHQKIVELNQEGISQNQ